MTFFHKLIAIFVFIRSLSMLSIQAKVIEMCRKLIAIISNNNFCYRDASDKLFGVCYSIGSLCDAPFDVRTALEVITTGTYGKLPSIISDMANVDDSRRHQIQRIPKVYGNLLRRCLLDANIPRNIFPHIVVHEEQGYIALSKRGFFEIYVCPALKQKTPNENAKDTLIAKSENNGHDGDSSSSDSFWHILDYKFFVESNSKPLAMLPTEKEMNRMSLEVAIVPIIDKQVFEN